jgi:EpsD family peptidyl-prolyl cis-trans isomerase
LAEISEYFQRHPEYFAERKQVDIQQLIVATRDVSPELKLIINSAKSLDMVAAWLDKHNVRYSRGLISRSTADLPEQIVTSLKELQKGDLFLVKEGENSLLNAVHKVKNSPVTTKEAAPQIEQYLIGIKSREAVVTEVARLRSLAKIEFLNASAPSAQ